MRRRKPFEIVERRGERDKGLNSRVSRSKRTSHLRLEKDLDELSYRRCERDFARSEINVHKDDDSVLLPNVRVLVYPLKGPFMGGRFEFDLKIPENYPYSPPTVHCLTRTLHPNICFYTGRVEFSILSRAGWRPVLGINDVILGLQLMFLEPQKQFATNKQCWDLYCSDIPRYENFIRQSLHGGKYEGYDLVNHFEINYSSGSKRTKPSDTDSVSASPGLYPPQKRRRLVSEITNQLSQTHVSLQGLHHQQPRSSQPKKRKMDWLGPCDRVSRRRSDGKCDDDEGRRITYSSTTTNITSGMFGS